MFINYQHKRLLMTNVIIRHVNEHDEDACYTIESVCYTTDAATTEKFKNGLNCIQTDFWLLN